MIDKHDIAVAALKAGGDAVSFTVVIGTLANVLPSVAAAFSIAWYALRFWDRFRNGPRFKDD